MSNEIYRVCAQDISLSILSYIIIGNYYYSLSLSITMMKRVPRIKSMMRDDDASNTRTSRRRKRERLQQHPSSTVNSADKSSIDSTCIIHDEQNNPCADPKYVEVDPVEEFSVDEGLYHIAEGICREDAASLTSSLVSVEDQISFAVVEGSFAKPKKQRLSPEQKEILKLKQEMEMMKVRHTREIFRIIQEKDHEIIQARQEICERLKQAQQELMELSSLGQALDQASINEDSSDKTSALRETQNKWNMLVKRQGRV